jgi:anti-sigma regulatory factor (Ser/Thr protein kinase)
VDGVELRFPPSPGHVRTARLVAAAVARRALLDDVRLDELRLAVGEACARAVRRCESSGCFAPVVLTVDDTGPGLTVEVADEAPVPQRDEPVVLSLLRGLADAVVVLDGVGGEGGRVRMEWWPPLAPGAPPSPSARPSPPVRPV